MSNGDARLIDDTRNRSSDYRDVWLRDYPLALASLDRGAQLARLICSLRFLDQKLRRFGADAILDDIDNCIRLSSERDGDGFRALADTIRLARPALSLDPSQLASQISGRLITTTAASVLGLVGQARAAALHCGLLPLTPALTQGYRPGIDVIELDEKLEDIAVTPDGKFVVTAAQDGRVSVWSLPLRGDSRLLTFKVPGLTSLSLSADGRFIITGQNGVVAKWDRITGFREGTVETGGDYVQQISLVGADYAVAMLRHGDICLVNLESLSIEQAFVAQVPQSLCGLSRSRLLIGTVDGFIDLFDPQTGERIAVLGWHGAYKTERMSEVELFARSMSSTTMYMVSDPDSMERLRFDKFLDSFEAPEEDKQGLRKSLQEDPLKHAVHCISADVDGKAIALSGCGNGELALLDLAEAKVVRRFRSPAGTTNRSCVLSSSHDLAAGGSYEGQIRLWRTDSGIEIGTLTDLHDSVCALHFIPGSSQLIAGFEGGRLQVWQDPVTSVTESREEPLAVRLIASINRRAYTITDSAIICWSPQTQAQIGRIKFTKPEGAALVLSGDNRRLMSVGNERIVISDICTGWTLSTIECEPVTIGPADALELATLRLAGAAPDLQRLLTYRYSDLIPVTTGNHSRLELRTGTGELIRVLDERAGRISELIASPDGRWAVTLGSRVVERDARKVELKLWDLSDGDCVWNYGGPDVTAVAFSETGSHLWFREGRSLRRCVPEADARPEDVIETLAPWVKFRIEGQFAIGIGEDQVEVWDLNSSARVGTLAVDADVTAVRLVAGALVLADRRGRIHFLANDVFSSVAEVASDPLQRLNLQGGTSASLLQKIDAANELSATGTGGMAVRLWREIADTKESGSHLRLAIAAQLARIGEADASSSVRVNIVSDPELPLAARANAIAQLTPEGAAVALKLLGATIDDAQMIAPDDGKRELFVELLNKLVEGGAHDALAAGTIDSTLPEIARVAVGHALGRLKRDWAAEILSQLARAATSLSVMLLSLEGLRHVAPFTKWIELAAEAISHDAWDEESLSAVRRMLLLGLHLGSTISFAEQGQSAWYELGLLASSSELNNRAMALARANLHNEALALLEQGTKIFPTHPRFHLNRSGILIGQEKWEAGIEEANQCLALDPDYEKALNFRAFARMQLEQFELALEDLDRALKLKPGDFANHRNRASCYSALGRLDEAAADSRKADQLWEQRGEGAAPPFEASSRPSGGEDEIITDEEHARAAAFLRRTGLMEGAVALMKTLVNDQSLPWDIRSANLSTLGILGAEEALEDFVQSKEIDPRLRIKAAGNLLKRERSQARSWHGGDSFRGARQYVTDLVVDARADEEIRHYAAHELLRRSDPAEIEAVARTIPDLGSEGEEPSRGVSVALVLIKSFGPRKEFARLEALAASRDANGWLRELASQTIGVFSDPERARALSMAHLAERPRDPVLVRSIERALGMYRDPRDPRSVFPDPISAEAFQAILMARSNDELGPLIQKYLFLNDPEFIRQIEQCLPSYKTGSERESLRQKLDHLKSLPLNIEHLAFRAFAEAQSPEQMRAAAVKFPMITNPDFHSRIESVIRESIPEAEHAAWWTRLEWLRAFPHDQWQRAMEEFVNAGSESALAAVVQRYPFVRTSRFRDLVKRAVVVGSTEGLVDERLRWLDAFGQDPGDSLQDEIYEALISRRPEEALEKLNRLHALDLANPPILLTAQVYLENGQYEKAIEWFTTAIDENPNAIAYRGRAKALFVLKQLIEAVDDFTRAIELSTDDADALLGRGLAFERLRNWEASAQDLNRALELRPTDELIAFPLALAYLELGEMRRGRDLLEGFGHWSAKLQAEVAGILQAINSDGEANEATAALDALYQAADPQAVVEAVHNHPIFWDPNFQASLDQHISELEDERERARLAPRLQVVMEIVRNPGQVAFSEFMAAADCEAMVLAVAKNELLRDPAFIAELKKLALSMDDDTAGHFNQQLQIYTKARGLI